MAFNAKRNDPAKFTEGAWVEIMGGRFKVARAGNSTYESALERSGYRRAVGPDEKEQALMRALAEGILKDWDDVVDAKGKPIKYSVESATAVLEENPDLMTRILAEAQRMENFRRDDISDQAEKQSAGSGSS